MNYHVAFVGNPNVGKSAWINALSNAEFKVGNWPGVTVEKKEANVCWGGDSYHIIDLPGTYSLTNNGNEEKHNGSISSKSAGRSDRQCAGCDQSSAKSHADAVSA